MTWTNYHTHCIFCDGSHEPRAYVEAAMERGMRALGFSSHGPLPFPNDMTMKSEETDAYCRVVRSLAEDYAKRLEIRLGLEIDFIPELNGPRDARFDAFGLDYRIGSVHYVDRFLDGEHWCVENTVEIFERGLREVFQGRVRPAAERYYALLRQMLTEHPPDILGHMDVIKKFNSGERFFEESDAWYRDAAFETLETLAATGVILEVNTAPLALKRLDSVYPSRWILDRAFKLGIPIMMNSDAHCPELVAGAFETTARMLREVGYEELMILGRNGWTPRPYTPKGLEDLDKT